MELFKISYRRALCSASGVEQAVMFPNPPAAKINSQRFLWILTGVGRRPKQPTQNP